MIHMPRRQFLGVPLAAAASVAMSSPGRQPAGEAPAGIRRLMHPGFVDLQVNGFAGVDFNDPDTTPAQVPTSATPCPKPPTLIDT